MINRSWIFLVILLVLVNFSCAQMSSKKLASRAPAYSRVKETVADKSAPAQAPEGVESTTAEEKEPGVQGAGGEPPSTPHEEGTASGVAPEAAGKGQIPESEEYNKSNFLMRTRRLEPEMGVFKLEKAREEIQYERKYEGKYAGKYDGKYDGNKAFFQMEDNLPVPGPALKRETKGTEKKKESEKAVEETVPPSLREFRIRSRFPEILFFYPNIETNESGETILRSPVGDAISTYDISVTAASKKGEWGRGTASFRTFKPFFIDFDPPRKLHVGDRVNLVAALFNYTDKPINVDIQIRTGSGLVLENNPIRRTKVNPKKAAGLNFTVKAAQYGKSEITFSAKGSAASDSVVRQIEIVPAEAENRFNRGGILKTGLNDIDISLPQQAITSAFSLRVYGDLTSGAIDLLHELSDEPHSSLARAIAYLDSALLAKEKFQELSSGSKVNNEIEKSIDIGWGRILAFRDVDGFAFYPGAKANPIANIFVFEVMQNLRKARPVDRELYKWLKLDAFEFIQNKKHKLADRLYAASLILNDGDNSSDTGTKLQSLMDSKQVSESRDPSIQGLALYCASRVNRPIVKTKMLEKLERNLANIDFASQKVESDILAWRGYGFAPALSFALKGGLSEVVNNKAALKAVLAAKLTDNFQDSSSTPIEKIDDLHALSMMGGTPLPGSILKSVKVNGKKLDLISSSAGKKTNSVSSTLDTLIDIKPGANKLTIESSIPGVHYQVVGRYYFGVISQKTAPDVNFELPEKVGPDGAFHAKLAITTPRNFNGMGTIIRLTLPPGVKPTDNPRSLARRVAADYAEVHESEIVFYYGNMESDAHRSFIMPMVSDIRGEFYVAPPSVESDASGTIYQAGKSNRVKWI